LFLIGSMTDYTMKLTYVIHGLIIVISVGQVNTNSGYRFSKQIDGKF